MFRLVASMTAMLAPLQSAAGWLTRTGGHGFWIAVLSVIGVSGTVLSPVLLSQPVMLMLLTPRAVFVAMAAPHLSFGTFVLLGLLRLSVADASYYELGRHMPGRTVAEREQGIEGLNRLRRVPARVAHRLAKGVCGSAAMAWVVLFLRPSGRYMAIAGAYGVSRSTAATSSVLGTVVYLAVMHEGIQWLLL